jgi:uncharacterized protein YjbI with pentapeptide repeats
VIQVAVTASVGAAILTATVAHAAPPPNSRTQLELDLLRQQGRKLQIENDRATSDTQAFLDWAPFGTVVLGILGIMIPVANLVRSQHRDRQLDRQQRERELDERFDEQFALAVANLGSDNQAIRVSGAVALHNFLRPDYARFHAQVYSVVCANLTVPHDRLVNRFLVRAFADAARLRPTGQAPELAQPLDLARCRMTRIDLSGLDLAGADLAFAILDEAVLAGANLSRALGREVRLERARLQDANLEEARLRKAAAAGARFQRARLVSVDLRGANLRGAQFYDARLQAAHLDGADLTGARFDGANLGDAWFVGATLDDVALRSIGRSEVVAGAPTWAKAHFDTSVRARLEAL